MAALVPTCLCAWILLLYIAQIAAVSNRSAALKRLHNDLFSGYVKHRPPYGDSWPYALPVIVRYSLFQIGGLDGKEQVLKTSGKLAMSWHDSDLSWDRVEYDYIDVIELESSLVWIPAIGLANGVGNFVDPIWKQVYPVFLDSAGDLTFIVGGEMKTSCGLSMFHFPFDTQRCPLIMGSFAHMDWEMYLVPAQAAVDLEYYIPSNEFSLVTTQADSVAYTYDGRNDTTIMVSYGLVLKRNPTFYLLNIIVPAVIGAFLSTLIFFVPFESGEKLSLGITLLLSFLVFLLCVAENTPQSSTPPPLIVMYISTIISLSGLTVAIQTWSLRLYHMDPSRPLSGWIRILTCIDNNGLCQKTNKISHENDEDNMPCRSQSPDQWEIKSTHSHLMERANLGHSMDCNVLRQLNVITDSLARHENEGKLKDKCRKAAARIDSIMFGIFLVFHVLILVAIVIIILCDESSGTFEDNK